jgi:hypothetical protein
METAAVVPSFAHGLAARCAGRTWAALAIFVASIIVGGAHAAESALAKITVSASPAASYFGERLIEGVMEFRGRKYLLNLQGVSGSTSSVGSVFGIRRARDIVGRYTSTADGLRNESGVTIRFDPPLEIHGGPLQIELAGRIYPKASSGQGGGPD